MASVGRSYSTPADVFNEVKDTIEKIGLPHEELNLNKVHVDGLKLWLKEAKRKYKDKLYS